MGGDWLDRKSPHQVAGGWRPDPVAVQCDSRQIISCLGSAVSICSDSHMLVVLQ